MTNDDTRRKGSKKVKSIVYLVLFCTFAISESKLLKLYC